jgi:hypothetical protein
MASTDVTILQRTNGPAPCLYGRFTPGDAWYDAGAGVLWTEHAQDIHVLREIESWTGESQEVELSTKAETEYVHVSGHRFIEIVTRLAQQSDWVLSDELALYVHIQRVAMIMVEQRDVLAFAAPESARADEVFDACRALAQAGEDGLGHWGSKTEAYAAAWAPAWTDAGRRALRTVFISLADEAWQAGWSLDLGWEEADHGRMMVDVWVWKCVDAYVRQFSATDNPQEAPTDTSSTYRIMYRGEEEIIGQWRAALKSPTDLTFRADGWLLWRTLRQSFHGSGWASEWFNDRSGQENYHLEVSLVPPRTDTALPDWKLIFEVSHNVWDARARFLEWFSLPTRVWKIGKEKLHSPDEWIFPKLHEAAKVCPAIDRALQTVRPFEASLSPDEVFDFLTTQVPALEGIGFPVRYPNLDAAEASDVRIRVQVKRLKGKSTGGGGNLRSASWFDTGQLVEFDWTIAVGETELSRQEFEKMVEQRTPFVQLGGSWKLIPIQAVLEQMAELRGKTNASGNLMQFTRALLMNHESDENTVHMDVSFAPEAFDAKQVMGALLHAHQPKLISPPEGFQGTLRSYQQLGFSWLLHLRDIGCGGVLADDMGLGKTIQILAYLLYLKEQRLSQGVHILICPTSLLQNWRAEMAKFAPELRLYIHHGATRNAVQENGLTPLESALEHCDVVMTTYATAVRDIDALSEYGWDVLIADEAQNVKNHETKQAQALRNLQAFHRIALTGTPIENRLEELWSIFQLTNPGYLGNLAWFRKMFVDAISGVVDAKAMRRLHQLLRPVLLRRSKTDPEIQIELPEKWEVREHAGLTPEQAALYQSVVNRLFDEIGGAAGMSRRGQILTALVRLKQVCDHPCLAMGGSTNIGRSGKLKMLLDLMQVVVDEGESALVFTQFRDMGELLCKAFEERFGWRPKFLHGGLSAAKRGEIVEQYQSGEDPSPVLVLSLKAGGVGLNLTRANHVFHYDRWWNPAVEDQATDRAFRIGQVRDVQVHKLVCPGTLEERIDALIHSKRMLSSAVVGESEGWITEMDNESLRALFALDSDAAVEDDE